jgi:DegV family protein with EDD domain
MQIVTDRGCDISPEQLEGLPVHFAPMRLTLGDKTYSSGEDLSAKEFYDLLSKTTEMPVTSQATSNDFANLYRKIAQTDPDILSIHISSGLSGTFNSALAGAEMVPEARVTHWDTKTLSCPEAWQVEYAARAVKDLVPLDKILTTLGKMRNLVDGIFTVESLKYLIHGGRISHIQGLLASILHIRPVIAVGKDDGKYYTIGKERTTIRALQKIAETAASMTKGAAKLRIQLLHGDNPEALSRLEEEVKRNFDVTWLPTVHVGPILGAHTGYSLVGLCVGSEEALQQAVA